MIAEVEKRISDLEAAYRQTRQAPFPYEDLRRLRSDFPKEFSEHDPHRLINADLNHHFMSVEGWASGGIRRWIDDPAQRDAYLRYLQMEWYEAFPQYCFLRDLDLTPYPALHQQLALVDKLRRLLVEVILAANLRK